MSITNIFLSMKDADSVYEYNLLKEEIKNIAPLQVITYFEENWWNKTEMWARHLNLQTITLGLTTTNHVESYHSKIKKFLNHQTNLNVCISRLIYHDAQIITISKLTSILNSNARHYNTQLNNPIVNQIKNDLTHFASGYVIQQFLSLDKTAFQFNQISSDPSFNVVCSNTSCVVTFNNCTCYFFKNVGLF